MANQGIRTMPQRSPLIGSDDELDRVMSTPSSATVKLMRELEGDLIILGVGGKMGPTLARLARRAIDEARVKKRVIGVSRFSDSGVRERLEEHGVQTIACDLLDPDAVYGLPDAPNVISMAGMKFGSTGNMPTTWAINAYLPSLVCRKFSRSRIVIFSTGNVYPFTAADEGGASEDAPVSPVGEYGMACLGRERIYEYFCREHHIPMAILRLCYAIDLRYGVLLDLAQRVEARQPIDLTMGYVNIIWQGDANDWALRSLAHCESPPLIWNMTGKEVLSVRGLAMRLGERLGITPRFRGKEGSTALLGDARRMHNALGSPAIDVEQMLNWTAHWMKIGGATLGKPTHFESRGGPF